MLRNGIRRFDSVSGTGNKHCTVYGMVPIGKKACQKQDKQEENAKNPFFHTVQTQNYHFIMN
jgi:hypothetical protein